MSTSKLTSVRNIDKHFDEVMQRLEHGIHANPATLESYCAGCGHAPQVCICAEREQDRRRLADLERAAGCMEGDYDCD